VAFRSETLKRFKLFPLRSEAVYPPRLERRTHSAALYECRSGRGCFSRFAPHRFRARLLFPAPGLTGLYREPRKVDVRLPGKGKSNSHGARPVHLIITMIKWVRTSRLSIKNSLSGRRRRRSETPCTASSRASRARSPLVLKLTEVPLLL